MRFNRWPGQAGNSVEEFNSNNFAPRRRRGFIWGPVFIALGFFLLQYLSAERFVNPETGALARVSLSEAQEASLGLRSFQEVLQQSRVIRQGPQLEQVRRVANRLVSVVHESAVDYKWDAQLIESEQANAFCLPGGKIAVYTGILPITRDDDGLAAVMGHEIAHATSRHGAQRMFQQNLVQTALMGLSGATAEMDQRERRLVLGALGAGVQFGVILPYGRDHENEADLIGLKYLIRAGYRPESAVEFWQRMQNSAGSRPPEWASTHPSNETRIENLRRYVQEYRSSGTILGKPVE